MSYEISRKSCYFSSRPHRTYDYQLLEDLSKGTDLSRFLQGTAAILSSDENDSQEFLSNGCFIAPNLVVTIRHQFREDGLESREGLSSPATLISIPSDILAGIPTTYIGDQRRPHNMLDACFLQLEKPLASPTDCLRIPQSLEVPIGSS